MKYKVVDLFSGCGGLTLGFERAGFKVVAAVDNWEPAVKVYRQNFNHPIESVDLSDVEKSVEYIQKFKPDIIVGGPPCQDFSHAGKRNENLGRGNLTVSYAEIINRVKPKFFVMENVDRLVGTDKFKTAFTLFKQAGYGITVKLMDASLCGVPQRRKRYFVIGELGGNDQTLEFYLNKNLSQKSMTIRDYLGDTLGIEHYYRHPRNYNRRGIFSINEPSPTIRGVNRPLPKGYPGNHRDSAKNLKDIRPLTTAERSYIQTFPKDFKFNDINKSDSEQLIGNAVPVKLAEYVAKAILEYSNDKKTHKSKFPSGKLCDESSEKQRNFPGNKVSQRTVA